MRPPRFLLAAFAAAALLAPAEAPAGLIEPMSAKRGAFRIAFNVDYDGRKPRRITRFQFDDVVMNCDSGPPPNPFTTDSERPHFGPLAVNRTGRFGRVFTNTGNRFRGDVVIRGEFLTRRRVEGTLKITGDYPNAGYENCTSTRLEWSARVG